MINYQKLTEPEALQPIEIDYAITDLKIKLTKNLNWLSNPHGRIYRKSKDKEQRSVYYPEIYIGLKKGVPSYAQVTPDNDKSSICFFTVGDENYPDFHNNNFNYLRYSVGLIFWVNLEKINKESLSTELITQNLISDVRDVLTRKLIGTKYRITLNNVKRDFTEVFREFNGISEMNTMTAPYQCFRFNFDLVIQEDCKESQNGYNETFLSNLNKNELLLVSKSLDFNSSELTDFFTTEQIEILTQKINKL